MLAAKDFGFPELPRAETPRREPELLLTTRLLAVVPRQYALMPNQRGGAGASATSSKLIRRSSGSTS
ncbi:hypothetical protein ACFXPA_33080 [Amycolatopsis sp. NPDC059090]|uniref:hypothetical protein n=1 Tax=unclassified Amycolatopsis TaxID=2618356 RepID=UPI00366B4B78